MINILLEKSDTDVDVTINDGRMPLFIATEFGHPELAELLPNTGKVAIEVNLSISARQEHVEAVRLLLDTGPVDVEVRKYSTEILIYFATKNWNEAGGGIVPSKGMDLGAELYQDRTLGQALAYTKTALA